MATPTLAAHFPDLEGLRVLVVGLGRSGLAAARLAHARGARVIVSDKRTARQIGEAVDEARLAGAEVRTGEQAAELVQAADLLVVSPGVPSTIELLAAARRLRIPIWAEVELAARFCRGRVIGITGSNGKSTVTSMIGLILRRAGLPGGTGGNLDDPFCSLLLHDDPAAVHAVELSSFQLEAVEELRVEVAVILNLSPDHLDRYPSFEAYGRAKARLLEIQRENQYALLNADDAASEIFRGSVRGSLHLFSTRREVERGAFVRGGHVMLRTAVGEELLLPCAELPLPGEHNLSNALAAALACRLAGCGAEVISAGLRAFEPLPHRLQHVRTLRGIAFYNDSKATNPESTICALSSFPPGSVQLILGGRDKNADWSSLKSVLQRYAARVLLVGEAATPLRRLLANTVPLLDCGTVERAVEEGLQGARPGAVVLLSPGCASFDQYRSFEERGNDFRRIVEALPERGGDDA